MSKKKLPQKNKEEQAKPVLEVNYPTEPTFEQRELNRHNDVFEQMPTGQLIEQVEAERVSKEEAADRLKIAPKLGKGILTDVYVNPETAKDIEKWTMDVSEDGTIDVIPPDDIEDGVANKVVLEQTLPHHDFDAKVNYNFDVDGPATEDVTFQEGKRWVNPPAEKLELKNTSPYAANIQEIKISEDFNREALNELGKVGPYNRYANFPVEITEPITLQNPHPGEARKLPPVNSLVAPKSVKAIEQAPIVNNGGTVVPQAPQAQPVGRQRHTFKARPDKEGRNV